MIRLKLLVEGQTEETFVRDVLAPFYLRQSIYVSAIVVETSPGHKGGLVSYAKAKPQLLRLSREDASGFVSTMFDLYALPKDFPGKQANDYPTQGTGQQKAEFLERELKSDINEYNFIPNIVVHEFEALLFSNPKMFSSWEDDECAVNALVKIAADYSADNKSPEDINDSPHTAPSKRILKHMPNYDKPLHGSLISEEIGLDAMRAVCPHFAHPCSKIEDLKR
jgi:hypothetical protein